jgi:hypothetical protein
VSQPFVSLFVFFWLYVEITKGLLLLIIPMIVIVALAYATDWAIEKLFDN